MINRYEQQKLMKSSVHNDMEKRVSDKAKQDFQREAYPRESMDQLKNVLQIKRNIIYLQNHIGMLDSWEIETIRRIKDRIQKGSGNSG